MIRSTTESRIIMRFGDLECGSSAAAFSATRATLYVARFNKWAHRRESARSIS